MKTRIKPKEKKEHVGESTSIDKVDISEELLYDYVNRNRPYKP